MKNLESPFDLPLKFLRYLGFFLEYDANWRGFLQKCFTIYSFLALFISIPLFAFGAYKSIGDIKAVSKNISVGLAGFEAFVYVLTYCVWSKKLKFLMDDIMDNLRTDDSTDPRDVAKLTKFTVKFMKFFESAILLAIGVNIFPPFFDFVINGNRQQPENLSFWKITESPFIELMTHTILWVAIVGNSAILFYGTIYLSIGLLLVLTLRNIRKSLIQMKGENFDLDKFKAIVQRHVRACEFFGKFSDFYAPMIIVKFTTIATLMCVNGFVLIEVGNDFLKIIQTILGFFLVHTGVLTLLIIGTMISTESAQTEKAIYDVFLDVPKTVHTDLLIMMSRSQKNLIFKAWVFQASIATFTDIVNAAYSYITILRTLK